MRSKSLSFVQVSCFSKLDYSSQNSRPCHPVFQSSTILSVPSPCVVIILSQMTKISGESGTINGTQGQSQLNDMVMKLLENYNKKLKNLNTDCLRIIYFRIEH